MQELLDVVEAVVERLGDPGQFLRRGTQRVAIVGDETLHLVHGDVEVTHRGRDLVGIVGEQPGHRSQVLVELTHQVGAVLQRRHQGREVLDRREDVGALVAQCRERLRQFDDRVTDVGALSAQVVGGGVDHRPQRADPARLGRLQRLAEHLQLPAHLVPLDRHGGAFDRDHGVVFHHRSARVGRSQLDGARGDQRGRQDRCVGVRGDVVAVVVPERDLHPLGLRLDRDDAADRHPQDAHVVALVDAVAVLEVGHHVHAVDLVGGAHQHRDTGYQQRGEHDGHPGSRVSHGVSSTGTSGGASPGAGT